MPFSNEQIEQMVLENIDAASRARQEAVEAGLDVSSADPSALFAREMIEPTLRAFNVVAERYGNSTACHAVIQYLPLMFGITVSGFYRADDFLSIARLAAMKVADEIIQTSMATIRAEREQSNGG